MRLGVTFLFIILMTACSYGQSFKAWDFFIVTESRDTVMRGIIWAEKKEIRTLVSQIYGPKYWHNTVIRYRRNHKLPNNDKKILYLR